MRIIILIILAVLFIPLTGFSQWTQCNGPYGGNVDFIAQNKVTNTLFAASKTTGLYRYKNGVNKWEGLQSKFHWAEIDGIAMLGATVFVSNSIDGLYKSTDDGNTWTPVFVTVLNSTVIGMMQNDDSTMILSTRDSTFISHNGSTFSSVPNSRYGGLDMVVNRGRLMACTTDTNYHVQLSYSDDWGQNWHVVYIDPSYVVQGSSTVQIEKYLDNFYAFVTSPIQQRHYYVSADSGQSWAPITCNNLPFCYQLFNQFMESSYGLLGAAWSGVYVYSGSAWSTMNNGLYISTVDFICRSNNDLFICFGDSSLFSSNDQGSSWVSQQINILPTYYAPRVSGMTNMGNRVIVVEPQFYNNIYYTDDGGLTWGSTGPQSPVSGLVVVGTRIYANIYGGIAFSDDSGSNWYWATQQGIDTTGLVPDVGYMAADSEAIIAVEFCSNYSMAHPVYYNALIYSVDSGNTFMESEINTDYFNNIKLLGSKGFACNNVLSKSDDKGATWYIDTSLHQNKYTGLYTIAPNFVLIASDSGKIFLSSDTGKTWADITGNFSATAARQFYYLGTNIYAITPYGGMWKMDATSLGIPNNYVSGISANDKGNYGILLYPNPSNNLINVILPAGPTFAENGLIKIYNSIGQQIMNEEMPAGTDTFTITTAKFPKGVYYLEIRGIGSIRSTKFIVD